MLAGMMSASHLSRMRFSCPVELSLAVLGGKWKTVILAHLKQGPLRYGDLRARTPLLADKVLNDRLRELEAQGLVTRRKAGRRGSPSTYELTRRGQSLGAVLQALYDWGEAAAPLLGAKIEAPRAVTLPDPADLRGADRRPIGRGA